MELHHLPPRLLLVEPQPYTRALLRRATSTIARVFATSDFVSAQRRVSEGGLDFLVTNVRLGAYNGLHLVYSAAAQGLAARCIVYTERHELCMAQAAQLAGAFYETRRTLPFTIAAYLNGMLPEFDRRDPSEQDRRSRTRGGRRCWDQHVSHLSD